VAINLPNFVYVYLAFQQPESRWLVTAAVAVEQFGYGFGFAGYMLYMLYISRGEHETAHYAICTGLMALGMMIPGLFCGKLQEFVGYEQFFVWIMIATIPSFVVTFLVPIDADFGRKLPAGKEAEGSGP
jgi:PAT family beta-lactamase induction signal transducer AmpG